MFIDKISMLMQNITELTGFLGKGEEKYARVAESNRNYELLKGTDKLHTTNGRGVSHTPDKVGKYQINMPNTHSRSTFNRKGGIKWRKYFQII